MNVRLLRGIHNTSVMAQMCEGFIVAQVSSLRLSCGVRDRFRWILPLEKFHYFVVVLAAFTAQIGPTDKHGIRGPGQGRLGGRNATGGQNPGSPRGGNGGGGVQTPEAGIRNQQRRFYFPNTKPTSIPFLRLEWSRWRTMSIARECWPGGGVGAIATEMLFHGKTLPAS